MGTDITVCHKRAAKSDTKWSCPLFHPCSLHPWPLEPQEPVTMVQQPLSVRPNKLPARRASSAGPSMSPCGTLSRQEPKKVCDEGSVHAPLAAPVHQAAPSVQDLLNYGVPAV